MWNRKLRSGANCDLGAGRAERDNNFARLLQRLVPYTNCRLDFNRVVIDPVPRPYHFCYNIRIRKCDERESAGCLMDAVNQRTIRDE